MHYVSGHEVAKQLTTEVYQLAFSPTKAWVRREATEETYMCRVGDTIALKLYAQFNCSPEMMTDIILERQAEWDLNYRDIEILEEYDTCNKILLLKCQIPIITKIVNLCLYRCVVKNYTTKQFHIVYQSIDHERIPVDCPVIPVSPSGYFISSVPGEPNKCQLTSVFQFPADNVDTPNIVSSFCSSSERIIAGLRGVVMRSNEQVDNWDTAINLQRKELYDRMHDVEPSSGWNLRFQYSGIWVYTKQYVHGEFCTAMRTSFTLPFPSHDIVASMFKAFPQIMEWDPLIDRTEPADFVRDHAYLQQFQYKDKGADGHVRRGCVLSAMQAIKDNVCDLSYKISLEEKPTAIGCVHGSMPSCGFIVHPASDNTPHSTVQYLLQVSNPTTLSDEVLRREVAGMVTHLNGLVNYISKQLSSSCICESCCNSTEAGTLKNQLPFLPVDPCLTSLDPCAPPRNGGETLTRSRSKTKRKLTSRNLMNVEDVVFKNPRKPALGISPTKPFLFLVSDDGAGAHRFVRRRRGSPLLHSTFDLLPQEILLEIFQFLDPASLGHITHTCTHFKELVINCQLWRILYQNVWGEVKGRVARRYCGDDDPSTFFTSTFSDWKELFFERQYIEYAWEAPERRALSFSVTKAHARAVRSMAMLPSRHRLVTGSQDKLVRVWDVTSGTCLFALQGTSSCVSVEPWGDTHAKVGYSDGVVRVFDIMSEECASEIRLGEMMRGCLFAWNSIISWHETAIHWDENTGQAVATFAGHTQRIKDCAYNSFKSILFTASRDTTVRLWDIHTQSKICAIEGHTKAVNAITLLGENQCLTGSSDTLAKVWDLRRLSTPLHVFPQHSGKIHKIKCSPIGQKICIGGEQGVTLWHSTNDSYSFMRKDFEEDQVSSVTMDEESIVYGGSNGQLKFYDFTPHR